MSHPISNDAVVVVGVVAAVVVVVPTMKGNALMETVPRVIIPVAIVHAMIIAQVKEHGIVPHAVKAAMSSLLLPLLITQLLFTRSTQLLANPIQPQVIHPSIIKNKRVLHQRLPIRLMKLLINRPKNPKVAGGDVSQVNRKSSP